MKTSTSLSSPAALRGSALLIVILFTTILALLCGSFLSYAITEKKINRRNNLTNQSRYLAESVADYGFAQMTGRFDNQTSLPTDEFRDRPLQIPRNTFLTGYNTDTTATEIIGGTIPGTATVGVIDSNDPSNAGDPLRGQNVFAREIAVYARAGIIDSVSGSSIISYASQRLQVRDAPLFANAIFYNLDMEISPGATMDIHGSVHSNQSIFAATDSTLRFHDTVSTAGSFFHNFHPLSGKGTQANNRASNITIDRININGTATALSLYLDSRVIDSTSPTFANDAESRWNRRLQTEDHGVMKQNPVAIDSPAANDDPMTDWIDEANPGHALIDRARPLTATSTDNQREIEQQRLSNQAGLRIVVNPRTGAIQAFKRTINIFGRPTVDADGNVIESAVTLPPNGSLVTTYATAKMYDQRRQTSANATTPPASAPTRAIWIADVDVGKLKQVIENPVAADPNGRIDGFSSADNWNGIVYVEASDTTRTGVRLINGQSIPDLTTANSSSRGMTFATNSPLYVKGHFNANGAITTGANDTSARFPDNATEPPAAIAADAITILSPTWNDANSGNAVNTRIPTPVEISAAFLTGLVKSVANNYSGGVENFPRFLENWSGQRVAIRGSMVALFESKIATQRWNNNNNTYSAPNRLWGYNELFRTGVYPPGTPNTRTYRRIHYRQLSAVEYEALVAPLRPTP